MNGKAKGVAEDGAKGGGGRWRSLTAGTMNGKAEGTAAGGAKGGGGA
jgi:hypothetical protein